MPAHRNQTNLKVIRGLPASPAQSLPARSPFPERPAPAWSASSDAGSARPVAHPAPGSGLQLGRLSLRRAAQLFQALFPRPRAPGRQFRRRVRAAASSASSLVSRAACSANRAWASRSPVCWRSPARSSSASSAAVLRWLAATASSSLDCRRLAALRSASSSLSQRRSCAAWRDSSADWPAHARRGLVPPAPAAPVPPRGIRPAGPARHPTGHHAGATAPRPRAGATRPLRAVCRPRPGSAACRLPRRQRQGMLAQAFGFVGIGLPLRRQFGLRVALGGGLFRARQLQRGVP